MEDLVAGSIRDRESVALELEGAEGGSIVLRFHAGIRVSLSPATSETADADAGSSANGRGGARGRVERVEREMRRAVAAFASTGLAITLDERPEAAHEDPGPDLVLLDAFELLRRGVMARGGASPRARAIEADGRPLVLHRDAALDVFRLGPHERKLVGALEGLPRTVDQLRSKKLMSDDELLAFLAFLVVSESAFFDGDDVDDLEPLGLLAPEERALRETPPDTTGSPPPFASRFGLGLLGLALAPLALLLTRDSDLQRRLQETLRAHLELAPLLEQPTLTVAELLRSLPERKIIGALLPYDSLAHLPLALASAGLFLGALLVVFERGRAKRSHLALAALFTATVGVAMLFAVQLSGTYLRGVHIVPGGWASGLAAMMIGAVQLVSRSYEMALDPTTGVFASVMGFTFGAGLCEEAVKVAPVLDHYRRFGSLDRHGALAWGLASGVGLGVAEGVLYAGSYYNGVDGALTYVVRFTSCIALHAVWTATAALHTHALGRQVHYETAVLPTLGTMLRAIAAPMVLHGLYDTFLKKGADGAALAIAVASFALLLFRIGRAR